MEFVTHSFGGYPVRCGQGSRLDKLCVELKQEFPELKMGYKRKLWWHWVAHVLICIFTVGLNRRYISGYTTTGKNRVDWSDGHNRRCKLGQGSDRVWSCLRHEREHLRQFRDRGTALMVLIWLFPPVLFCYGRAVLIEKPGYLESLRANWELHPAFVLGYVKAADGRTYRDHWVSKFTGPAYGWMWILKGQVGRWYDEEVAKLEATAA